MTTGIDLILADHRLVDALFVEYQRTGDPSVVGQIFDALTMHDEAEAHALYPLARAVLDDEARVDRAYLEHSELKMLIEHARALEGAPLAASMEKIQQTVEAHVAEEEKGILPALRKKATPAQLDGLAARIEQIKQRVG
jgi:hemerythrin superfamily protein